MADGSEDDVGGVALATLEVAAAEVPIVLHVANDGFDGRAAAQFALDDAEDAALLTGSTCVTPQEFRRYRMPRGGSSSRRQHAAPRALGAFAAWSALLI